MGGVTGVIPPELVMQSVRDWDDHPPPPPWNVDDVTRAMSKGKGGGWCL